MRYTIFKNRSHLEAKIKPNIKHPVGCFTLFLQLMVELELQKNTFQKEKKKKLFYRFKSSFDIKRPEN